MTTVAGGVGEALGSLVSGADGAAVGGRYCEGERGGNEAG